MGNFELSLKMNNHYLFLRVFFKNNKTYLHANVEQNKILKCI